jgi:hypothetical protein
MINFHKLQIQQINSLIDVSISDIIDNDDQEVKWDILAAGMHVPFQTI